MATIRDHLEARIAVPSNWSTDGARLLVSSNLPGTMQLYELTLGGPMRPVYADGGFAVAGSFSPDGAWLAVVKETEKSGDNEVYLIGIGTGEVIRVTPHDDDASSSGPAWLPDGSGFYFSTDIGRDVSAIAFYDMSRRRWDYVLEPGWECHCAVDWAGRHLLVVANEEGLTRAELRDPRSLTLRAEVPLPGRGVAMAWTFSHDGRRLAFHHTSPLVPGDV